MSRIQSSNMVHGTHRGELYEFSGFRVDTRTSVLSKDERPLLLTPKAFELLLVFVRNSGVLLEKETLLNALWPDSFVEEACLTQNIYTLRKVLGDGPNQHRYIATIPKRGYRFIAEVRELPQQSAAAGSEESADHSLQPVAHFSQDARMRGARRLAPLTRGAAALVVSFCRTRRAILAAALLLVVLVTSAMIREAAMEPELHVASASIRSIAVLPFRALSEDNSDEYLGIGIADALITKLGSVEQIVVRPTSAVRKYSGGTPDPVAAGREQRVESVLEGGIQRVGDRLRVTLQLVSVESGVPMWTAKFDESFTDLFRAEDSISQRVAEALMRSLSGEERRRLAKHYTEDVEAHQLYLRGRYFWNKRTPQGITKAIEYFEQAVARDSSYALAYAGLADCYKLLGFGISAMPVSEMAPRARKAAEEALKIDNTLAEARASLGDILRLYDWNWDAAEIEFKESLDLSPNYPPAHQWYGLWLAGKGRYEEAIAEVERAQALDPVSLVIGSDVARILCYSGQHDRAIEQCLKTLEMDRGFWPALLWLGIAYQQKGMQSEAISSFRAAVEATKGGNLASVAALGRGYALAGRRDEARKILTRLKESSKRQDVSPYYLAVVQAALGEKDKAFEELQKACDEHSSWLAYLKADPVLDNLRSDRRFNLLLERIGLAP